MFVALTNPNALLHMHILESIPSEAKCRSLIRQCLFGKRLYCPHCFRSRPVALAGRYFCRGCRKKFSLVSCSWLRRSRIRYRTLWLLILCWQRKIPFGLTVSIAGVSAQTVRRYHRLFRDHLVHISPELGGVVEVDEAFFGRRRHGRQRIVIGAIARGTGRIALRVIKRRNDEYTDDFILDHIIGGSTVCTDGAGCYEGIDAFWGYRHIACNHSVFHFGPTNRIESVWSSLKRFLTKTLGRPNAKDLPKILREFEARNNHPETFENPLAFLKNSLTLVPLAC